MAIEKPSWFKMDAAKFLSDAQVDVMSTLELGACFRLMCRQWIDGSIPDDQRLLARLCRLNAEEMGQAWVTLATFFPITEPGKRANRFMWLEREKVIADLERKSDEGTRAARKRWNETKKGNSTPNAIPNGSPMPEAMQEKIRIDKNRAEADDATGMPLASKHSSYVPNSPPSHKSSESEFSATEAAQFLCSANGWSGYAMIWALQAAIEFQSKVMPEAEPKQVGEWLVKAYSNHRTAEGKFAVKPQKFFEQGLYSTAVQVHEAALNPLMDNPATRALAQMEAD